jgi:hypothetical protein
MENKLDWWIDQDKDTAWIEKQENLVEVFSTAAAGMIREKTQLPAPAPEELKKLKL